MDFGAGLPGFVYLTFIKCVSMDKLFKLSISFLICKMVKIVGLLLKSLNELAQKAISIQHIRSALFFIYFYFLIFILTMKWSLQDLSSLTGLNLCTPAMEVQNLTPLDHQGTPNSTLKSLTAIIVTDLPTKNKTEIKH